MSTGTAKQAQYIDSQSCRAMGTTLPMDHREYLFVCVYAVPAYQWAVHRLILLTQYFCIVP